LQEVCSSPSAESCLVSDRGGYLPDQIEEITEESDWCTLN